MAAHSAPRRSLLGSLSRVANKFPFALKGMRGLPKNFTSLPRRSQYVVGGGTVAIVVLIVGLLVGGVFSSSKPLASTAAPNTTQPAVISARCPLTDLPAPNGVQNRPVVAIKVGNEPGASRPQSGLNEADIVFDTPAEGFIMRYVAVFQCNNVASIGPVRSVRWVDWHITEQFAHPILAFAGGINPDVDTVMGLGWLEPANLLEGGQAAGHRISSRSAPDNLYTSTSALYGLFKSETTPPTSVFSFTPRLPSGAKSASSLGIDFSGGTDVVWKWDAASHSWLHTYSNSPDIDALTGKQVATTNIVVMRTTYTLGPYSESPGGSGDVESQTVGSGEGYVLRDGMAIKVTWHRAALTSPLTFTNAAGQSVGLAPGRTWVEIVPDSTFDTAGRVVVTYGVSTHISARKTHKN